MNKEILHLAIALLSRREHSLRELKQKLLQRRFVSNEIDDVLAFLASENYQSDIRAAESIFRNRVNRGYGWLYIQNELKNKGIAGDIIQALQSEQDVDWYQQAADTYQKKFKNPDIKEDKEKAKRMRFLQYRGFTMDEILTVLKLDY